MKTSDRSSATPYLRATAIRAGSHPTTCHIIGHIGPARFWSTTRTDMQSSTMRPINLEKLHEASGEQLAEAYAVAMGKAHDAPKEISGDPPIIEGSMAWARFSREAGRIYAEMDRRGIAASVLDRPRSRSVSRLDTPQAAGAGCDTH